jgi:hypothetical protein
MKPWTWSLSLSLLAGGLAVAAGSAVMLIANGVGAVTGPTGPIKITQVQYLHTDNNRAEFAAAVPGGAIGFSGGRDEQPDPEHYTLHVDHIVTLANHKFQPDVAAQGDCVLLTNAHASVFISLECHADAAGRPMSLSFRGDGSPNRRQPPPS